MSAECGSIDDDATTTTPSDVRRFYAGRTVFVTGVTGRLGKLIVAKLLHACPEIERVYVLMRQRRDLNTAGRFHELFHNSPVFERLHHEQPNFMTKISVITGDCCLPQLGLLENGRNALLTECDVIVHAAADNQPDANLKVATNVNVRGTRELIRYARQMPQLKAFVYVSSAFANCTRRDIDEMFYEMALNGRQMIDIMEAVDAKLADEITPALKGHHPNVHLFTKALGEDLIRIETATATQQQQQHNTPLLPIGIIRPAYIGACVTEPYEGWLERTPNASTSGIAALVSNAACGMTRVMHVNAERTIHLIPADFLVNAIIVACVDINNRSRRESAKSVVPIYNCVNSPQKPLQWGDFLTHIGDCIVKMPPNNLQWCYMLYITSNIIIYKIAAFLLHYIPAYVIDMLAKCCGYKSTRWMEYEKRSKIIEDVAIVANRELDFHNLNYTQLWLDLNKTDRRIFNFNVSGLKWRDYCRIYMRGVRRHLLEDSDATLPSARRKLLIYRLQHYCLIALLIYVVYKLTYLMYNMI